MVVEAGDDMRLLAARHLAGGTAGRAPRARDRPRPGRLRTPPATRSATGRLALARGWHVARMNMRGAGDAEALCPRLYNAGLDGDLWPCSPHWPRHTDTLVVVGFSLGANLALLGPGPRWRSPPRRPRGRGRGLATPRPRRLRGRHRTPVEPPVPVLLRPQPQARPTAAASGCGLSSTKPAASAACAPSASTTTSSPRAYGGDTRARRSTTPPPAPARGSRA